MVFDPHPLAVRPDHPRDEREADRRVLVLPSGNLNACAGPCSHHVDMIGDSDHVELIFIVLVLVITIIYWDY